MQNAVFYFYNEKFYLIYFGFQQNFSNSLKKDTKVKILNLDDTNDNDKISFIDDNLKQNKIIYYDEKENKINIDDSIEFSEFYKNFYLDIYKTCTNYFETFYKSLFIFYAIKKDLINKFKSLGYNLTDENKEDVFIDIISLGKEDLINLLQQFISIDKITSVLYDLSDIIVNLDEFIYKDIKDYTDILEIFNTFDKIEFYTYFNLNNINFLEYVL